MLDHGDPSALESLPKGLLAHFIEGEFSKPILWRGRGRAQKGLHAHAAVIALRGFRAVALDLSEEIALPAFAAAVVHDKAHIDQIAAARENKAFGHVETLLILPEQIDGKLLSIIHIVAGVSAHILRAAFTVYAVLADQTALRHVQTLTVVFEQHKRRCGIVDCGQKFRQRDFDDIPTVAIDSDL